MNFPVHAVLGTAAALAFLGVAHAQEAAMPGDDKGAATMPDACIAATGSMPDHDTAVPDAGLRDHQAAMMQGMMATSGQMMQGVMAEDPDVAFACGMIPHHQAAINMAQAELEYGDDPDMKRMAQTIIDAQSREIDELSSLDRGECEMEPPHFDAEVEPGRQRAAAIEARRPSRLQAPGPATKR